MAIPARRRTAPNGGPAFSIRRTAAAFALAALLLWGGGTALRTAWQSAGRHPALAVVVAAVLVAGVVSLLRHHRHRRAARRAAVAVTEGTYTLVDTGLSEAAAALRRQDQDTPGPVAYAVMDADEFEQAVAGLCERDGLQDVQVVGGAGDLGADVVATTPDRRRVVIQCKRYGPENKVGSQDVQRFGGTCYAVHEADVALVVTTGEFTDPALDYADRCGILCVDHEALRAWSDDGTPPPWEAPLPVDDTYG